MKRATILLAIMCALPLASTVSAAAKKKPEREWKTGRVQDSTSTRESYVDGVVTSGNSSERTGGGSSTGQSGSVTTLQRVTVQINELLIVGDKYLYVIQDSRRTGGPAIAKALANRKHGCHFIVGEDIKYAQDKTDLYVLDVDGKECKVPILRQQVKSQNVAQKEPLKLKPGWRNKSEMQSVAKKLHQFWFLKIHNIQWQKV